jgi:threonine/homoserine/homoserine lactone efflux protein
VLIKFTPGPNMAYLFLVASRSGRAAGLVTVAGVTLGLAVYLVVAVLGAAEAVSRPWALELLRWAGVCYLVWLAADAWRSAGQPVSAAPPAERLFLRGFVSNVLNPKAAILYFALLPGFVRPEAGDAGAQALQLGLVHLACSVAVHATIVLAGDRAGAWLSGAGGSGRMLGRASALGLLAVSAWLALG